MCHGGCSGTYMIQHVLGMPFFDRYVYIFMCLSSLNIYKLLTNQVEPKYGSLPNSWWVNNGLVSKAPGQLSDRPIDAIEAIDVTMNNMDEIRP